MSNTTAPIATYQTPTSTNDTVNNETVSKEIDQFKEELMGKITNFLIEITSILTVVLIWGFICANIISFVRPDSKSKSGSFTNTIMNRLDQFFPHDIEKAPYGFDKTRGIANQETIDAYKKNKNDNVDNDNNNNNKDECKVEKFFVFKDENATEFPYTWSALPLEPNRDTNDPIKMVARNDTAKDSAFMIGARIKSFMNFTLEWLVHAIYFSYGNHRQLIKKMFRMLNKYMIEKTPSSLKDGDNTKEDNESQYEYMSNLMVMFHLPLLFIIIILPFFVAGIGAIMMIAGSFWNQLPVKNYNFEFFKLLEGICMTLVVGSFTVLPIAAASYFIQPAMFFGKLLFYQILCPKEQGNLKKVFVEIVPALVTIFALGVCYSAFFNFPEPFSYVLVVGAIIAYCIVFKDEISNLLMFLGMIKSNILKTKTLPSETTTKPQTTNETNP
jgi:hypothetical protein